MADEKKLEFQFDGKEYIDKFLKANGFEMKDYLKNFLFRDIMVAFNEQGDLIFGSSRNKILSKTMDKRRISSEEAFFRATFYNYCRYLEESESEDDFLEKIFINSEKAEILNIEELNKTLLDKFLQICIKKNSLYHLSKSNNLLDEIIKMSENIEGSDIVFFCENHIYLRLLDYLENGYLGNIKVECCNSLSTTSIDEKYSKLLGLMISKKDYLILLNYHKVFLTPHLSDFYSGQRRIFEIIKDSSVSEDKNDLLILLK